MTITPFPIDPASGRASGWSMHTEGNGFVWQAFGPRGSESGKADDAGEAQWIAKAAFERLKRP